MKSQRNYREVPPPASVAAMVPGVRLFLSGACRIMVSSKEPTPHFPQGAWHLSISCSNRNPTWEEIRDARYDLCPHDITMAQILPPPEDYVNCHEFCFHLHEIPGESRIIKPY